MAPLCLGMCFRRSHSLISIYGLRAGCEHFGIIGNVTTFRAMYQCRMFEFNCRLSLLSFLFGSLMLGVDATTAKLPNQRRSHFDRRITLPRKLLRGIHLAKSGCSLIIARRSFPNMAEFSASIISLIRSFSRVEALASASSK